MQIDCYGFEASSQWFKRRTLDPYLIKRSEGKPTSASGINSFHQYGQAREGIIWYNSQQGKKG